MLLNMMRSRFPTSVMISGARKSTSLHRIFSRVRSKYGINRQFLIGENTRTAHVQP